MNRVNPSFAMPYGPGKLSQPGDVTIEEAEDIYKAYYEAFPDFVKRSKKLIEDAPKHGHVISPAGRKIYFVPAEQKENE